MMLKLRVPHLVAAGVVVALAIGFGIGLGGNDHAARSESPILPDLVTLDTWGSHLQLDIQEVRYRRWRQRHLRLVNEVVNLGLAPLQLEAVSEDCDGDGQRKNDRTAYQRLFYADGSSTLVPVGCMEHHHQHHHWHFEGFARYELWNLDGTSTGRTSDKVSFCVMDVHRHSGSNAAQFTSMWAQCRAGTDAGLGGRVRQTPRGPSPSTSRGCRTASTAWSRPRTPTRRSKRAAPTTTRRRCTSLSAAGAASGSGRPTAPHEAVEGRNLIRFG